MERCSRRGPPGCLRGTVRADRGRSHQQDCPEEPFRRSRASHRCLPRKVVAPGSINAHTHFYSTFARGLTNQARQGLFVLKNLWWRLDSASTPRIVITAHWSRSSTNSSQHNNLIDHHASPNAVSGSLDAIARAVDETGLRACLCYEVLDRRRAPESPGRESPRT